MPTLRRQSSNGANTRNSQSSQWQAAQRKAGLVGSVSYYLALAHNFHRTVADPFTRPASRALRYHAACCCAVLLVVRQTPAALFFPLFLGALMLWNLFLLVRWTQRTITLMR